VSDTNSIARKHGTTLDKLTWVAIISCLALVIIRAIGLLIFPIFLCAAPCILPVGYVLYLFYYAWFKKE